MNQGGIIYDTSLHEPNKINSKNKNKLSIIIPNKIIAKISISQAKK
jgi:hypothetical protein